MQSVTDVNEKDLQTCMTLEAKWPGDETMASIGVTKWNVVPLIINQ